LAFLTFSSANDEYLIVLWKDEATPLLVFEIASGSGMVAKCVPNSEPNSFVMDIIGGIKRNSPKSIRIDIDNDNMKYYGPLLDDFIEELTGGEIKADSTSEGTNTQSSAD
jgi:hypothetical protein